jgi:hypothetical protein
MSTKLRRTPRAEVEVGCNIPLFVLLIAAAVTGVFCRTGARDRHPPMEC